MPSRRSTRKSSTDWWIWTHFLCIPIRFVVSPLELLMHWFLYNHSIWLPIHLTVTVIWLGLQVGFNVYIYSFIHYFEWKWDSCLLTREDPKWFTFWHGLLLQTYRSRGVKLGGIWVPTLAHQIAIVLIGISKFYWTIKIFSRAKLKKLHKKGVKNIL